MTKPSRMTIIATVEKRQDLVYEQEIAFLSIHAQEQPNCLTLTSWSQIQMFINVDQVNISVKVTTTFKHLLVSLS